MTSHPACISILVLYGMPAEASPCFRSLRDNAPARIDGAACVLFDNSPALQPPPPNFRGIYLRDPTNPGLATAYNAALRIASEQGIGWLMLLDQDTIVTRQYLDEVEAAIQAETPEICAFVPKLMRGSTILSPLIPPFAPPGTIGLEDRGPLDRHLHMFNSGAVLRVTAVKAIGGFPLAFPLDYLDHATFHLLQAAGGKIFLLRAALEHSLSQDEVPVDPASHARRHGSVLRAASRFYQAYGSAKEQRSFRRDLIRQAIEALRHAAIGRAMRLLKTALGAS